MSTLTAFIVGTGAGAALGIGIQTVYLALLRRASSDATARMYARLLTTYTKGGRSC